MTELFVSTEGGLFVVLDGGRNDNIHAFTRSANLPWMYLVDGVVDDTFKICAPRVIEFGEWAGESLLQLLDEIWSGSSGVFVRTNANLVTLRRHLSSLLTAALPNDMQVFFRYFDPRVLRAYLPTCTPDELELVFGPISEFMLEGPEQPDLLLRYRNIGGSLQVEEVALTLTPPTPGC